MVEIRLEGVTKRWADGSFAVRDVDLSVGDGELMVLVGPSGCGKSTLLRIVAGLDRATEGAVRIGGRIANDLAPGDRDVAMVFQDYALYPHMTAHQNIAFALTARRLSKREIHRRVVDTARLLGIEELLSRKPKALSGGERQRVAMGRAIVRQPSAFLMDEPLSNLDAKLRVQMRTEMRRLHDELGATFLFVTHDQVEAVTLGDRVAVLREGRLQQVDQPQRLYTAPANLFVAAFIGSPPTNLMVAAVEQSAGRAVARIGPWAIPLGDRRVAKEVVVGIRPEHLEDPRRMPFADPECAGEVLIDAVEPLGSVTLVHFSVDGVGVTVPDRAAGGATMATSPAPAPMVAAVDGRVLPRPGDRMLLAVDVRRVQVFDPTTGRPI